MRSSSHASSPVPLYLVPRFFSLFYKSRPFTPFFTPFSTPFDPFPFPSLLLYNLGHFPDGFRVGSVFTQIRLVESNPFCRGSSMVWYMFTRPWHSLFFGTPFGLYALGPFIFGSVKSNQVLHQSSCFHVFPISINPSPSGTCGAVPEVAWPS